MRSSAAPAGESVPPPRRRLLIAMPVMVLAFLPLVYWVVEQLRQTGHFSYPLDDTFIHLEIAKHLALDGTWGITPGVFGSASSSPLYTVLLAGAIRLFGLSLWLPLVVNGLAGLAVLLVAQRWLERQGLGARQQLFVLLAFVVLVPLPTLMLSGMEHTLQCLFTLLFLFRFTEWTAAKGRAARKLPPALVVYALLMVSIRYEGLFLLAIACGLLAARRRWLPAMLLGGLAVLPVALFGLYSLSKGSYFLPNSVLVKAAGGSSGVFAFLSGILTRLFAGDTVITYVATQRLLLVLPLLYLLAARRRDAVSLLLLLLSLAVLLHLSLASTGWFYRYEAYLVAASVLAGGVWLARQPRPLFPRQKAGWVMTALLLFVLCFPFVLRSSAAFTKAGAACRNIYEQQYQMGRFLEAYYPQTAFAANDIGAVSYFTDGPVLDLWGLASIEVARSRRQGRWTPEFLDSLARSRGVPIAIVYDSWFPPALLRRWTKVATWQIRNNVICGDDTVSFYAIDPLQSEALLRNLQAFAPGLPAGVVVRY